MEGETMEGETINWNLHLPGRLTDAEIEEVSGLTQLLSKVVANLECDSLQWKDGGKIFTVKECFKQILSLRLKFFKKEIINFNWQSVWVKQLLSKGKCFIWTVAQNGVLTQENLKIRGCHFVEWCVFCQRAGEDILHLFFQCEGYVFLWNYFLGNAPQPSTVWDAALEVVLKSRTDRVLTTQGKALWVLLAHAILWGIRVKRNTRLFDDVMATKKRLKHNGNEVAWRWASLDPSLMNTRLEDVIFTWERVLYGLQLQ